MRNFESAMMWYFSSPYIGPSHSAFSIAYSGDSGHPFRLIPATDSGEAGHS
jgi:hypothetical protein